MNRVAPDNHEEPYKLKEVTEEEERTTQTEVIEDQEEDSEEISEEDSEEITEVDIIESKEMIMKIKNEEY